MFLNLRVVILLITPMPSWPVGSNFAPVRILTRLNRQKGREKLTGQTQHTLLEHLTSVIRRREEHDKGNDLLSSLDNG